jgi:hypothetical protein
MSVATTAHRVVLSCIRAARQGADHERLQAWVCVSLHRSALAADFSFWKSRARTSIRILFEAHLGGRVQGAGIVCGCPSRRAELRPFSRARGPLGREYLVSTSRDPHLLGKRGDVGPCVDGHPVTSAASITANRYRTGGGPAHYKYQLTYTPKTDPNLDATTPCTEFPTVPRQPPYTLCMPGYPPRTCTLPFAGDLACFTYLLTESRHPITLHILPAYSLGYFWDPWRQLCVKRL